MDLQINKDNTVKLPTAINNSEVAIEVKEVREVVKGILSAELKIQTLTPRIFNIFKTFQILTVYSTSTVYPSNTVNSYSLNSPASIMPSRL